MLKGEHYGTPADVFSFSIVMYELLTFSVPYADMLKTKDGEENMSLEQISALTHKEG